MNEEEHKLGIRASSTRQVFFNDIRSLLKTLSERAKRLANCNECL